MKSKKSLVIVESPAKAKTIEKYLDKSFMVRSCMGHVRDLPKGAMGIDIEDNFNPRYVVIAAKRKIVSALKKDIKGKDFLYLASDPDREGEAISWHLENLLGEGKKTYRVSFNEITKESIEEAFQNPQQVDINKVNAQQARRVLDRIVGYSLSPLLWKKVGKRLSAGRVQTVALRLLVDREREIQAFKPQEYWEVDVDLTKIDAANAQIQAKLIKINGAKPELDNEDKVKKIVEVIKTNKFFVHRIDERERKQSPLAPFITSTLQQEAFNKLRFSASKTMLIAQQLYEGIDVGEEGRVGLITYMRTDSVRIAQSAQEKMRFYILENYGPEYLPGAAPVYKSRKRSQEAHESVRVTLIHRTPEKIKTYLNEDQYKLYELIWKRTLASQMPAARYLARVIDVKAGEFLLRANGRKLIFPGFLVLFVQEEEKFLPDVTPDEELKLINIIPSQHFTKPPARYTDASLVKIMEEKGIGRPSTYAPTIRTLVVREYASRRSGQLVPCELGFLVVDLLVEYFPNILDLGFTAQVEEELDKVEGGALRWFDIVKEFYEPFSLSLEEAKEKMRDIKLEMQESGEVCELCGEKMLVKWGRNGRFLGCAAYPVCKNSKSISTGVKCTQPDCGGELVKKKNKKGRSFYGCSNYPKCSFTSSRLP